MWTDSQWEAGNYQLHCTAAVGVPHAEGFIDAGRCTWNMGTSLRPSIPYQDVTSSTWEWSAVETRSDDGGWLVPDMFTSHTSAYHLSRILNAMGLSIPP
jgi:hypothetical protein